MTPPRPPRPTFPENRTLRDAPPAWLVITVAILAGLLFAACLGASAWIGMHKPGAIYGPPL